MDFDRKHSPLPRLSVHCQVLRKRGNPDFQYEAALRVDYVAGGILKGVVGFQADMNALGL